MSGPIVASVVRLCGFCRAVFLEDPQMYLEPDLCPNCGQSVYAADRPQDMGNLYEYDQGPGGVPAVDYFRANEDAAGDRLGE